jgi:hypothetical protein
MFQCLKKKGVQIVEMKRKIKKKTYICSRVGILKDGISVAMI